MKEAAIAQVAAYCATRVPADLDDEIQVEYELRGNTITLYERRPPWREDVGSEWTSMRICVFEWDHDRHKWTLYSIDRNDRRRRYEFAEPASDLMPLLREVDNDPTGIFWG